MGYQNVPDVFLNKACLVLVINGQVSRGNSADCDFFFWDELGTKLVCILFPG